MYIINHQVMDRDNQMDNPCTGWLSDSAWDNITELDKLTNFHGIITSFEQYPRDWNIWYTSATPETTGLPGEFLTGLDEWAVTFLGMLAACICDVVDLYTV